MNQQNPLTQYYRQVKSYIPLPGGQSYYEDDVVAFSDSGEVGIRSMTSADEIMLKNPDALLNGEAVKSVLKSCVVGLNKPEALLNNDIDAILAAIQGVSYKNNNVITTDCPRCEFENTYSIDIDTIVASAGKLEPEYFVNLSSGATVFIRPFTFKENLKATAKGFEQAKVTQALENSEMDEMEMMKTFSRAFKEMAKLNFELLTTCISKIVDVEKGLDFENTAQNKQFVLEMLLNIDRSEAELIDKKVKEINAIGIQKKLKVKCQNDKVADGEEGKFKQCDKEWEIDLDLNPVNFSTGS